MDITVPVAANTSGPSASAENDCGDGPRHNRPRPDRIVAVLADHDCRRRDAFNGAFNQFLCAHDRPQRHDRRRRHGRTARFAAGKRNGEGEDDDRAFAKCDHVYPIRKFDCSSWTGSVAGAMPLLVGGCLVSSHSELHLGDSAMAARRGGRATRAGATRELLFTYWWPRTVGDAGTSGIGAGDAMRSSRFCI
jgi:hypothetical protein